jgi:hypothetical protein
LNAFGWLDGEENLVDGAENLVDLADGSLIFPQLENVLLRETSSGLEGHQPCSQDISAR